MSAGTVRAAGGRPLRSSATDVSPCAHHRNEPEPPAPRGLLAGSPGLAGGAPGVSATGPGYEGRNTASRPRIQAIGVDWCLVFDISCGRRRCGNGCGFRAVSLPLRRIGASDRAFRRSERLRGLTCGQD